MKRGCTDGRELDGGGAEDYVSSCGFSLMPVVYQVVGFGRGFGRHSGRRRQSVASSVKDDDVASRNESEIHAEFRLKHAKYSHASRA